MLWGGEGGGSGAPGRGALGGDGALQIALPWCSPPRAQDPEYPARELLYHSQETRGWCTPRRARWRLRAGGREAAGGAGGRPTLGPPPRGGGGLEGGGGGGGRPTLPHRPRPPTPSRLAPFPHELTLRLEAPARLTQVQLLSHEFKIAGKVELQVALLPGGASGGDALLPAAADAKVLAGQQQQQPASGAWQRLGFLSFDPNERSGYAARELKSVALPSPPASLVRLVFHRAHANPLNVYGQASAAAAAAAGAAGEEGCSNGGLVVGW